MLAEFVKNQPEVKPGQAWNHFVSLARSGFLPNLVSASPEGSWIEVCPDPERVRTKRISRVAFARNFQLVRKEVAAKNS